MKLLKSEGIILEAVPYQDIHHIITAFTKDYGLIRCFVKGTQKFRSHSHAAVTPLTRLELCYAVGKPNTLFKLRDVTVLDQHLELRERLESLQLAGWMAGKLLYSQNLWRPAPQLYILFAAYIKEAGRTDNPNAVAASFLLKLLRHEGLLAIQTKCATCGEEIDKAVLAGETYCTKHGPPWGQEFSGEELLALCECTISKSFSEISKITVSGGLKEKIHEVYSNLID